MSFPTNRPKFFKVIIKPEANNLTIPTEFTIKHGHKLTDHVFVNVPSGKLWEIELIKSDDEILFEKGWEKFRDHYSVEFGYFLVFVYDGDSRFSVFMFDRTCTEIEYPFEETELESGVILDKTKKSETKKSSSKGQEGSDGSLKKKLNIQEITEKSTDILKLDGEDTGNDKGKDNFADQEGGSSGTGTGFTFTKELTMSNTHKLSIRNCTRIRARGRITLQNVEGGEWDVKIVGKKNGPKGLSFCSGWNKFLIDNKINVGSTMSFEFISSSKLLARVVKTGPNEKELFGDVRRKDGKYIIVASHDRAHRKPNSVPRAMENENNDDQVKEKENGFLVGSKLLRQDLASDFAKGIEIATVRENRTEIEYQFHDNDEDAGSESEASVDHILENCKTEKSKGKRVYPHQEANDESVSKKLKTEESAAKMKVNDVKVTENHNGVITDKEGGSSSIGTCLTYTKQLTMSRAYKLDISKEFEKCTGISAHEQITVQNMEGVEWPVSLVGKANSTSLFALCSGWNKFLVDNKVIVGSTISLKFIAGSKFQVQIVKPGPNDKKIFADMRRRGGKYVNITPSDRVKGKSKKVPRTIKSGNHDYYQINEEEGNGSGVGSKLHVSHVMKTRRQADLELNDSAKKSGIATTREVKLKGSSRRVRLIPT